MAVFMFLEFTQKTLLRMKVLEERDAAERRAGSRDPRRLRQIPRETGRFLALCAALAPEGAWVEIGTGGGYSTLWIAGACRERGRRVVTIEIDPDKAELARETFGAAGVEDLVDLVLGDGVVRLGKMDRIAFLFLDADKETYLPCYETAVPLLVDGGILLADNAVSRRKALGSFLARALSDSRVDATVVPVGEGVLLARKKARERAGVRGSGRVGERP